MKTLKGNPIAKSLRFIKHKVIPDKKREKIEKIQEEEAKDEQTLENFSDT